jgi:hypothetical protein
MSKFYVYGHFLPKTDIPFYIGKGKGRRAYHKYDRSAFWHNVVNKNGGYEVRILIENLSAQEALDKERELISEYGRRDIGTGILVNQTDGGDGVVGHSMEVRHKISVTHKGNVLTEEHRNKISAANKGRMLTSETKNKIRMSLTGKKRPQHVIDKMRKSLHNTGGKPIIQYDINGNFIAEHNTIKEAARQYGLCYRSIRRVLKGQLRKTKGYIFKYKEDQL